MLQCYKNNVYLYYLIPHTSHVCQPLDVGPFSSVKAKYRGLINANTRTDDAAPIKKQSFITYIYTAREQGMSRTNIQGGWEGTGIVPWCPRKIRQSSQVSIDPWEDVDIDTTPLTRPATPLKRGPNALITTPTNRMEYTALTRSIARSPTSRRTRRSIQKGSKLIDRLQWDLSQAQARIQSLEAQLQSLQGNKRRKVAIDLNKAFVDVPKIVEAQEQEAALTAAWQAKQGDIDVNTTLQTYNEEQFKSCCFQFHVLGDIEA